MKVLRYFPLTALLGPPLFFCAVTRTDAKTPEYPKTDQCTNIDVAGESWLDQAHDFVSRKLCQPAVWFDDFFGEERVLEDVRPTMFISLKNSARWAEGSGLQLIPDYSLSYRLPQLNKFMKKARFYAASGSDIPKYTVQPGQPVDPGVDPKTGSRNPVIGVKADIFTWLRSVADINTGIKTRLPLDPFIRARYQNTALSGRNYVIRFTETALWRSVEHFSGTSQADLEFITATFTLVRFSNYTTYIQGTSGMTWNTGVSFISQLTAKSAISYDTSMWGTTRPDWAAQNYRAGIKYRRNFYRPWLFFDLEPEVTWPKGSGGRRNSAYAFTATLEIQLGR